MAICLFGTIVGTAKAMEEEDLNNTSLIIGCRPWDENLQGVRGLEKAHFLDFMSFGAPETRPATFHHFDLNDTGIDSAGKFSDFAAAPSGNFETIIIALRCVFFSVVFRKGFTRA